MSPRVIRRQDYSLSEEQLQLSKVFASLFERESPSVRVRAAEPVGFDADLWQQLTGAGVISMALPEAVGGDDATLVDLALVAEEFGRSMAPVPLIDAMTAARLLAAVGAPEGVVRALAAGTKTATIALHPFHARERQLISSGAMADIVVGLDGDALVMSEGPPPAAVANLACAPLAWRDLSTNDHTRSIVAEGLAAELAFAHAVLEWKALMAAAQTGIANGARILASEYVTERHAFGVPIGTFQAISHPIVDIAAGVEGARRLALRAAWFLEHEPECALGDVLMAFVAASDVANRAASFGIHALGGLGFTLESDMQLYFRRARGWTLLAGDPQADLQQLGDHLYGPEPTH
ncbi:MAG TPA: acyl-CoA dehydrogenase family protein [Acidimicrobiia bacterium]|jgi:alkylation response protein AidB-like acyl-CoA dehydrogenase